MHNLKQEITNQINDAKTMDDLKKIKVAVLGKKGSITTLMKGLKDKSPEEKKELGQKIHGLKEYIEIILEQKSSFIEKQMIEAKIQDEAIDIHLPGYQFNMGTYHPLTLIQNEISEFFIALGYGIVDGYEIELDKYNFEMLNIPPNHPARDMQDTFYIDAERLLRTHTSPTQARTMEAKDPKEPIRIICPGKVYRRDEDDATHSHQFMQVEGLVVDKDISLADLKGTLLLLAQHLFGKNTKIRFRPSYFPFTEPSVEVDLTCHICQGKGCRVCKSTGWIEVLGSGQVHPSVLEAAGYDSEVYQGFAFGIGIERVAMLKYGVDDIRHFYTNNVEFLKQFNIVD